MMRCSRAWCLLPIGLLVLALAPTEARAQTPKSAALAKELAQALERAKLDAIAAVVPGEKDKFVAALYFQGSELLVVSARYSAPLLLMERLGKKEYRDIYIELNSASMPDSKTFIEDLGADGLKPRKEGGAFDTYERGSKRVEFDGDSKKQQMSEEEYQKTFAGADEEYTQILTALLSEAKKSS